MVRKRRVAYGAGAGFLTRRLFAGVACLALTACLQAQSPAPTPQQPPASFDGARAFEHLKQLVAIGPRPAGSEGIKKTRDYIKAQMSAIGLTATEQAWDQATPVGNVPMVNLSVTIPGTAPGRLIVGGHYDTKLFKEFTFVGANDAGSSTAFLIELARVLKTRQNALTIELVFFDGEEAFGEWDSGNTFGSRYYVSSARKAGTLKDIKALVLVDMIGETDPVFKRDENSTPWLVDIIWSSARKMGRTEFSPEITAISDDHLPFLAAGIPSVDIIDLDYPAWHEAGDTLDKVSPKSLQVVGDVLLAALPAIEMRLR